MAKHDGDEAIWLSYCRNFDEVETARSAFEKRRTAILHRLNDVIGQALENAGRKFPDPDSDDRWSSWAVHGDWTKLRVKRGKKNASEAGLYFGIDHDPSFEHDGGGRFGFVAGLYFAMSQDLYTKMRPSLALAPGARGCAIDYWSGRDLPSACIRTAWILPGDKRFTVASFTAEVGRLPSLFKKLDGAVTAAYERGKW